MLGPRGVAFDNDEALDQQDDEDLKNDPVSTMDMPVCRGSFSPSLSRSRGSRSVLLGMGMRGARCKMLTPRMLS